ncbi:MAG TPA: hypothetical protein DCX53_06750 [Anaerolineae bacterium]|nr:hypothetical protein [Anaerolineae bacterium]
MPLRDIVDVFIDRQTRAVSRVGFGTPLFVGETQNFSERVRTYSSIDGVAEDFALTDPEYLMALAAFSQSPSPVRVKIGRKDPLEDYPTALQAIIDEDDDWYGLAITSRDAQDILDVAAFIEARVKLFSAASADEGVKDPNSITDIAYLLEDAAYERTFLSFHNDAATIYPDAAVLGKNLPLDPGSITWKFKTLAGISADTFTTNERDAVLAKNANIYEEIAGVNIYEEGTVAAGEFIDVIHGIDWLTARIQERIYELLVNAPKIPYTNKGIAVIEGAVRQQLDVAVDQGVIAPEPAYTVTVPDVLDTEESDRAARILRDVNFEARLAGAIHSVVVRGTVRV